MVSNWCGKWRKYRYDLDIDYGRLFGKRNDSLSLIHEPAAIITKWPQFFFLIILI
jgi:hypothetical protein